MSSQPWECDENEQRMWEEDPERAARLCYLRLQMLWHEQVESGIYQGVPNFRAEPKVEPDIEPRPVRQLRVERDESASEYQVPVQVQRQFARLFAA